jgi:type II secretory pathway component GspD/PulD (secretin)
MKRLPQFLCTFAVACCLIPNRVEAQASTPTDSVSIRIQGTDLPSAVQLLGQYLDRPIIFAGQSAAQVTLETPRPIPRAEVLRLLRGIVESHGFEVVDDSSAGLYRVRPRETARPAQSAAAPQNGARRPTGDAELFMLALRHARAVDVAQTVSALYGKGSAAADGTDPVPTLGDNLRENLVPPADRRETGVTSASAGRNATLSGEITIVPDNRANTLLVRANRTDFELIRALVEQIDVRPLQVLIEVLIAEVRRDRSIGISVDGEAGPTPIGGGNTTAEAALGSQGLGDFALRVMGLGGVDAEIGLSLASQRGEVRILSRPIVLATNNQQASIIVGSQRPSCWCATVKLSPLADCAINRRMPRSAAFPCCRRFR